MANSCKIMSISALGEPFKLGMLYDVRNNTLVPGITLWDEQKIHECTREKPERLDKNASAYFTIIAGDDINEKAFALKIDANLKLSFLGGLIEVDGSAKYLDDRNSSNNNARVTLNYSATTQFRDLKMELLGKNNVTYQDAFENDIATHVVTGIKFGGRAFFVFDREVSHNENKKEVSGSLKVLVNSIPAMKIEGDASLNLNESERMNVDKFKCTLYADFVPEKLPTTYAEAIDIYRNLKTEMLGEKMEKAVPVKVWLYPLELLDSKAKKLVRVISSNLIDGVTREIENINTYNIKCNDFLNETVCRHFPRIKEQIKDFQHSITLYKVAFQQQLCQVLPEINGCGVEESELSDLLIKKERSPFSKKNLEDWLNDVENEINILSSQISFLHKIEFVDNRGKMMKIIGNPALKMVACYKFSLSKRENETLNALASYNNDPSSYNEDVSHTMKECWYKKSEVKTRLVQTSRKFHEFSEANQDNASIKCIVYDECDLSESGAMPTPGASICLYEDGEIIDPDFEPPTAPMSPTIRELGPFSVSLTWDTPKQGAGNVEHYEVLYRYKSDMQNKWITIDANDLMCKVSRLEPDTIYELKVRAVSKAGFSHAESISTEDGTIETQSVQGPNKLSKKNWTKPIILVIGATGSGKSTLCNVLSGWNPNEGGFPVSSKPDPCTYRTTCKVNKWLGTGQSFTIIDTPGLAEDCGKYDTSHISGMVEILKEIKFVDAFLIVFNGQAPRLDENLRQMLNIFKNMFGTDFLKNVVLEFSRWSFDDRSKERREEGGESEEAHITKWNKKLRQDLSISFDIPVVFVDACYLKKDLSEVNAFKEQTTKLWEEISKLKPFQCNAIVKVMSEKHRLDDELCRIQVEMNQMNERHYREIESSSLQAVGSKENIREQQRLEVDQLRKRQKQLENKQFPSCHIL